MGGRGGTGELGSHPRHVLSRTFLPFHGPQGTDRQIRTAAALRACALSGARTSARSGVRGSAMRARGAARRGARMGALCMRAERRARFLAHIVHQQCPKL